MAGRYLCVQTMLEALRCSHREDEEDGEVSSATNPRYGPADPARPERKARPLFVHQQFVYEGLWVNTVGNGYHHRSADNYLHKTHRVTTHS